MDGEIRSVFLMTEPDVSAFKAANDSKGAAARGRNLKAPAKRRA